MTEKRQTTYIPPTINVLDENIIKTIQSYLLIREHRIIEVKEPVYHFIIKQNENTFRGVDKHWSNVYFKYFPKRIIIICESDYYEFIAFSGMHEMLITRMDFHTMIEEIQPLPHTLKYLKLPMDYESPIEIPESVESIENYNGDIVIHDNVKRLTIDNDVPLNNDLHNIETLILTEFFCSHSILNLPNTIKNLKFYFEYDIDRQYTFPSYLVRLYLSCNIGDAINNLPATLEDLTLDTAVTQTITSFPPYIKELKYVEQSDFVHDDEHFMYTVNVPDTIINLKLPSVDFNLNISVNNNVKSMISGWLANEQLTRFHNLDKLFVTEVYNSPLNNLNHGLSILTIITFAMDDDMAFNQPLDNLPSTLKKLSIVSPEFDQPVDNLPESLVELYMYCKKFNKPLDNLPENLEKFSFYSELYEHDYYPPNTTIIAIYVHNEVTKDFDNITYNYCDFNDPNNCIDVFNDTNFVPWYL